jgi:uncharacterized protein
MIVGVIFATCWPLLLAAFMPNQNLANLHQDTIVLAAEWTSVVVLYAIVVRLERRPFFETVGLSAARRADWMLVGFFALAAVVACVILAMRHPAGKIDPLVAQAYATPLAMRVALVFTAGICEEILFRGYAIERLKILTGNVWIAAAIAVVLFTLAHIPRYGLSSGLIGVAAIAVLLSLIYLWRRNIAGCIALHWLIDGFALLILPAFVTLK